MVHHTPFYKGLIRVCTPKQDGVANLKIVYYFDIVIIIILH